ncbi:hypothetical protein ACGTNG_07505 [Halomonas sp. 1390]|uniref:hypothetical protein n=1 Tax=Halomonas sp. B23F22_3 TaxID=3459516 RepID=UPI00373F2B1A
MSAMHARLALLLLLATASPAGAEEGPRVSVSLTPETLAPGETAVLRYRVLVPTWMPDPVTFPSLDRPGLRVTLPERGTVPTSERIDGATWSGITRAYRLTPLAPGDYALGGEPLEVSYADPDGQAPITREVTPQAPVLSVTLPAAAEGLEPYVAAGSITLEQHLEVVAAGQAGKEGKAGGEAEDDADNGGKAEGTERDAPLVLSPGDSLTRIVTATVEGGTVMLLPTLIPSEAPAGLGAYPETPSVTERDDGGVREERVAYVAEGGVDGELPAIHLRWLDLDAREIAESRLPAVAVEAEGPAPAGSEARRLTTWLAPIAGLAVLSVLAWALRHRWPLWREALRQRNERSGRAALARLRRAVAARDLAATRTAWGEVGARCPALAEPHREAIEAALLELGRSRFGPKEGDDNAAWRRLSHALPRHVALSGRRSPSALPPLNPL